MRLVDREAEKRALDEVLDSVRHGLSRAVVLRGESGVGKSALLDYAVHHARDMEVERIVAVESEKNFGFAAVHELLAPFLPMVDRIPEPQRRALNVAFGIESGPHADPFLVGLAVLSLLSESAKARPLLAVIDDAQWLDEESTLILSFVARRLLAERVGLVFAVRETRAAEPCLPTLPSLRITGLSEQAAHELLERSIPQPMESSVAALIVRATGGNPLALVAVTHELTPDQLSGRAPVQEPLPVGHRLEASFSRRVRELPPETQELLLLAATGSPGQPELLWQAASELGIPESAAAPAEAAGLVTFTPEVRFVHPLVRSALYHGANADARRQAHRTLAAVSSPEVDAVSRAWHLSEAVDRRDEGVAADLEAAAELTLSRGGYAAAAGLLERSAELTPGPEPRAERQLAAAHAHLVAGSVDRADTLLLQARPDLRTAPSGARATRLRGRIEATCGRVAEAVAQLVEAARQLRPVDPLEARDALLFALESAAFAGWASSARFLAEIAQLAPSLAGGDREESGPDLLLRAYSARLNDGYAAGVPAMRSAVEAFLASDVDPDVALRRFDLTAISAADLLDEVALDRLTTRWIERARERGALALLAGGLAFRAALVDGPCGRLSAARTAAAEARELGEVTHNPAIVPPTGAHEVIALALSGDEPTTRLTAEAVAREAPNRGAQGEAALAAYGLGILEISLGNYDAALGCLRPAYADGTPLVGTLVLPDLVEAAVRAGERDLADRVLQRLRERATASGTPLALGLLARSQALVAGPEGAQQHYEQALLPLARSAAVPQLARAHLLYGEWLRRQRRRREARDQLRAALEMFEATGLDAFAERSRAELRATGERIRKRVIGEPEDLTPQEAHIATLVSRGEGNREIAAQLFISPSTVEYHLRKVFRKVGVTSRTELAHYVIHHGVNPREPVAVGSGGTDTVGQ